MRETGVSGASVDARIERYCNDVAGEILLPAVEISRSLAQIRRMTLDDASASIAAFANARKISRATVAYKLFRTDLVTEATWRQLADRFRQEWIASRARQLQRDRGEGGPSYYVVRRHRLGNALLGLVKRSLGKEIEALDPRKKILFMSGYRDAYAVNAHDGARPFLNKPFTPETLLKQVRQILDGR